MSRAFATSAGRGRWWVAPAVAHPRVLGRIPGVVIALAGLLGLLLIIDESGVSDAERRIALALAFVTVMLGAEVFVFGPRMPRWSFHVLAIGATAVATTQVFLYEGTDTGHQFVLHYFLIVAPCAFYFSRAEALIQGLVVVLASGLVMGYIGLSALTILDSIGSFVVVGLVIVWGAQLADQADRDVLTDLSNARGMTNALEQLFLDARRHGTPFSMAIIGIDGMSEFNGKYGFAAGNQLLVDCATAWRDLVPDTRLLSRYAGDEFVLLLPGLELPQATAIAEAMRDAAGSGVTVSIGVASLQTSDSQSTMVNRAFAALHDAKAMGRNRVASHGQDPIVKELETALANGDLFMLYQPVVRLSDEAVISREALVRWRHPVRGLIPPSDFIPEAERTGVIHQLGAWTLREACRTAAQTDSSTHIAVNVSVTELRSPGYVGLVNDVLRQTGLPARRLVVEVTEGVSDQFDEQVVANLTDLRRLGVRIAIDDFGSGYSSLRWVADFPVDILKIDGAFVSSIQPGSERTPILEAIIYMSWSLGLSVIAEHVETEYQADRLRELGCGYAQGYLFGHPVAINPPHEAVDTEATAS